MTGAGIALVAAALGAIGGVVGGAVASLATLRTSQLSARAPLGPLLHEIGQFLIKLNASVGTSDYMGTLLRFESKWNEFSVHQRILCPSKTISNLMDLVRATTRETQSDPKDLLYLAGQTVEKITQMVGAHSYHLFRFRARCEEKKIVRLWLDSPQTGGLSEHVRNELKKLT